mgnify:CR=1 FL=1
MDTELAPIALFVYARPWHTRRTVQALQENPESGRSELFIFSDAPRDASASRGVDEVREYIKNITGFKSVNVVERSTNYGLANSIIAGVSYMLSSFDRVVVVEDDLLTSKYFLGYMNRCLDLFEQASDVVCVHGYSYPVSIDHVEYYFLRGADCWGWATWRRGWALFEEDSSKLLTTIEDLDIADQVNLGGAINITEMLQKQVLGSIDSWAVRWYASAFIAGGYTVYPSRSLVQNIGFDGSGTHCGAIDDFEVQLSPASINLPLSAVDVVVEEDPRIYRAIKKFLIRERRVKWLFRALRRVASRVFRY